MSTSADLPDTAPGHRPAVATACGKVILLGEHSVVYGEPAMAVPLPAMRLSVVLAPAGTAWGGATGPAVGTTAMGQVQDGVQTLAMPVLGSKEHRALLRDGDEARTLEQAEQAPLSIDVEPGMPPGAEAGVSRALGAVAHALGLAVPLPLRVAVRSGGLRSGMGTSAALGVALSRALLAWYGKGPVLAEVLAGAAAVERLFHGSPSGVDHTVCASETAVWYQKDQEAHLLERMPPLDLVLRPRRSPRKTADLVEDVRRRLVADPALVRVVAEMGPWSRAGRAAWEAADLEGLARAMRDQQASLDRLGVVSEDDRSGIARALAAGALAAKVTGAGWGGTLLALATAQTARGVEAAWGEGARAVRIA